jgi:uncharacterized protein DUF4232
MAPWVVEDDRRRKRMLMSRKVFLASVAIASIVLMTVPASIAGLRATPSTCARSQLTVRSNGWEGTAGTIHGAWVFRNVSKETCTLEGYPSLQLFGKGGRPIPTHVKEDLRPLPSTVTLKPDASATFRTSYNEVAVPRCPTSSVMRVTPPGARKSLFIPATLTPCRGVVHVSAVWAGIHHA